ncbi:Hypothetical protein FKW44_020922 [Caligus rogercresseyi]|uniref:Uncharacterized protein n=1 Tax=Caligus rogercresseyi TaxID=217165 RepID=A0A7T8JUX8_CALRO|nr:Hypothetical protein FKW44_020922 [Caligus rogercresseyi]
MELSSIPVFRLCEEENETHIILIYACHRTRMEMDEFADDIRRRKKPVEEFLLKGFLVL